MHRGSKLIQRFLITLPTRLGTCRRCSSDSLDDIVETQYDNIASRFFSINDRINCLVIQPYIKWGPNKVLSTTPELQLSEAVSLVRSLNNWNVAEEMLVPLMSFDKTALFGSGCLQKLQSKLTLNSTINAVFISISVLKLHQIQELESALNVMVFDRYKIVVNILRLHALSNEAKLQVSLAEIPYLRSQINHPVMISAGKTEVARQNLLKLKEKKVKHQLEKLRNQRQLIRKRRTDQDFIAVSVIGYTNAGKTSLIKALTNDAHLKPRDYLFATLDVTTHMGYLPSKLPVLYTDTVGFMANIPTNLIECFLSTLEDAMVADVIIHIQNLAHPDFHHQNKHVEDVLKNLTKKLLENESIEKKPIIKVANKVDMKLIPDNELDPDLLCVSSKTLEGMDTLKSKLEDIVINVTNRKKIKFRIKSGHEEMRWLYKNGTVIKVDYDEKNSEYSIITVILTQAKINQFQHYFIKNKIRNN